MFITHPPRQTRENAPTSPCNHGKENTRATSADAPQAIVGGSRAIVGGNPPRQGTVSDPALRPKAEITSVFRVTFFRPADARKVDGDRPKISALPR